MSTSSEQIALRLSRWFGLMCVFGIAWSNAFFRVGLAGLLVSSLFSGVYRHHARSCLRQPLTWLALGFFLMVLASALVAGHPAEMAFYDVEHYRKLLLIPVFAVVFPSAREHRRLLIAYGLGTIVLMLPTLLDGFGIFHALGINFAAYRNAAYDVSLHGAPNLVYWRMQIVHGFHVDVLLAMAAFGAILKPKWRVPLGLLCLLCIVDVLLFIYGRMALLSLVLVVLCVAIYLLPTLRLRFVGTIGLLALACSAYFFIPDVNTRIDSIQTEAARYFEKGDIQTSGGERLYYWKLAAQMWRDAPLLGHGAGAFREELVARHGPGALVGYRHPHSEYLMQLAEFGLVGLGLFLAMVVIMLNSVRKIGDRWLAASLTVAILVFCLNAVTDASLHNDWEGWTFVVLASIACASRCFPRR
jgi:O-antigen ligase